jgi:hypothetical protein
MRRDPCIFEAICRKAMSTKGSTVTVRSKPFGFTGHKAKAFLAFLAELGCVRIRASRATKMVCPKEVLDRICQGYINLVKTFKKFGVY